jgi:hypothetical protein
VETGQGSDSSSPAKHALHFEDCPFCRIQADSVGIPPAPTIVPLVLSGSVPLPPLFYQSARPLFVWASAQSRAPPAHS